mmetsp:Transcript_49107/g.158599  ORF Transcript_49107/g.158599 Transcript_49107/m.158599 type:complete len:264 (-) Transcript_49107:472-1263(-)
MLDLRSHLLDTLGRRVTDQLLVPLLEHCLLLVMTADHCVLELIKALAPSDLCLRGSLGLRILRIQKHIDQRLDLGIELLRDLACDLGRGALDLLEAQVHLLATSIDDRGNIAHLLLDLREDAALQGDQVFALLTGLGVQLQVHAIFEGTELRPVLRSLRSGLDALGQALLRTGDRGLHLVVEGRHEFLHMPIGRQWPLIQLLHLVAQNSVLHLLQHIFELNSTDADPTTTKCRLSFHLHVILLLAVWNHVWHRLICAIDGMVF